MFVFFLRSKKTFRLTSGAHHLKSFPQFCSNGSRIYPHIISQVSQIIPQLTEDINNVPLFIGAKMGPDNTLNIIDPTVDNKISFYLVFYPDTENSPLKDPIIEEYWKSIQPMVICRDISGFYLGLVNDPNVILFEQCNLNQAECFIYKAISGYNESTMQSGNNLILNDTPIYIQKVNISKSLDFNNF